VAIERAVETYSILFSGIANGAAIIEN